MTNEPSQPTFTANDPPVWTITINGVSHRYREVNARLVRVLDK